MTEIRNKEILHSFQCPGPGHRINSNDYCQYNQNRHHDLGHTFHAILNTTENNGKNQNCKNNKPELCLPWIRNEITEIPILCKYLYISADVLHKILHYPSANGAVIRHDQHRNHCIQPAAYFICFPFPKGFKSTNRAFPGHPSNRSLWHDQYITKGSSKKNIDQQKDPSAIFCRQIWKTPDIAQSYRRPSYCKHITYPSGKTSSLAVMRHFNLIVHGYTSLFVH